jgi:hypothetical protein
MNASELAEKMLLWEKNERANNELAKEIESEVLKLEKTQVVGGARVTYSGGRSTYDYETPAVKAPPELLVKYATQVRTTDWDAVEAEAPEIVAKHSVTNYVYDYKSILKEANIEPVVASKTDPTATIKLDK